MADGYGFGGEGDWKTSVLLRTLKVAAAGLDGGTSFMEDYTYHLGPGEPKILGAHMLEVCPTITGDVPAIEIHPLGIGDREDPVRMVFTASPARGVVVGMADLGSRFRLVANEIEVVEPDELLAGGPHHTVLTTAIGMQELEQLADMLGTELLAIDADTRLRQFRKEIRWNQAYFRLAQGL
jgi:L-arabinose isomerase